MDRERRGHAEHLSIMHECMHAWEYNKLIQFVDAYPGLLTRIGMSSATNLTLKIPE